MIAEPSRPTEKYIEGRLEFHQAGAAFYARHCQSELAAWSLLQAQVWAEKLAAVRSQTREPGDGE